MVHSNTEFHLRIAAASGNKYFLESYRRILADHERIAQIWYSDIFRSDDRAANEKICRQHDELYQAIEQGDTDRAEAISIAHAHACKEGIRSSLSSGESLIADLNVQTEEY